MKGFGFWQQLKSQSAAGAEACSHPETEGMFWGEKNGQARRPVPPEKEAEE